MINYEIAKLYRVKCVRNGKVMDLHRIAASKEHATSLALKHPNVVYVIEAVVEDRGGATTWFGRDTPVTRMTAPSTLEANP